MSFLAWKIVRFLYNKKKKKSPKENCSSFMILLLQAMYTLKDYSDWIFEGKQFYWLLLY